MVVPLPDSRTRYIVACLDDVPIFLKIAQGITHGMDIFPHHERLVSHPVRHLDHSRRSKVTVVVKL